jgi:hypothetical protein
LLLARIGDIMGNSYILYYSTVILASIFAGLAQKYSKINKKKIRVPNRIFWFLSMAILIFIMGFRKDNVGVDDLNYFRNYNIANSMSLSDYYNIYLTEPGFYLLYRLVKIIFDDFQWLIIITTTITIVFFYKGFSNYIEHVSLSLVILIFGFTQYFYFFGIIRLGLAVAIIVSSLNYIYTQRKKTYVLMVITAAFFHYSAFFAFVFLFIKPNKEFNFKRKTIRKLIFIVPFLFVAVRLIIYPVLGGTKYENYINSSGFLDLGFVSLIPFLILFLLNFVKLKNYSNKNQFYFLVFILNILTDMFSPIIGIGRMLWYTNISIIYLLPATLRVNKHIAIKFLLIIVILMYCLVYSYNAYFGQSFRSSFMLPYKNIFFEFR